MLRGIVFDKDGTLFSFSETWGAWCERLLSTLAPDNRPQQEALAGAIGYNVRQRSFFAGSAVVSGSADETTAILAELLPDKTPEQIESAGLELLGGLPLAPVTNLSKLFFELKEDGYKLAVATNDYVATANEHLSRIGVLHCFDFVCGFDSGYGSKPEPGMINAFCESNHLSPSEVVMVGDSMHDLQAGRAAGTALNVGVLSGPAGRAELNEYADELINDISELPALLQQRSLIRG